MRLGERPWRQVLDYRRYVALSAMFWTLLVAAAAFWSNHNARYEAEAAALVAARTGFEKDMLYRRWAAGHGGVYVEVSQDLEPNPHLANVPERDITTPSGKKLTLVNPAYMTRQVFDLGMATNGPRAHITSLRPVRGENAADDWEKNALNYFEKGSGREFFGVTTEEGVEVMRFMGALKVEESCAGCHAAQGYKLGEVRGGIAVSVPLAPYLEMMSRESRRESQALVGLWLFGLLGLLALHADLGRKVQEREQVEGALAKSERQKREVLQNVSLIAIVLDPQGKVLFANDHFLGISGFGRDETLGADWFKLVHPDDDSPRRSFDTALLKKVVAPHHRTTIRRKDGHHRVINWSNTMAFTETGEIEAVTSIGEDITERLKAEERMAKLVTALDRAADAVILSDTEGVITFVNSAFADLTGIARDEAIGMKVGALLAGHNDRQMLEAVRQAAIAGKGWEARLRCVSAKAPSALYDLSAAPLAGSGGGLAGYVHVGRDVTERVAVEERLAQAQKLEALGTLAGGIAHDFNNILTAIQGWAELTLLGDINSGARENLSEILSASARAAELVRQILAFSRMGRESEIGPMAPAPLVKEAMRLIRATIPANIAIRQDVGSVARIMTNPTEIHRIIVNLCTNASHAMARGGLLDVRLDEIEVLASGNNPLYAEVAPGRYARLTVRDNGLGMSAEVKSRIFEPFFTTKKEGEGTGMGLSVVHGIVVSRGGHIFVESEPGKGSTFEVLFPTLPGETPEGSVNGAAKAKVSDERLRVLFVDDEHSVARLADKTLSRNGNTVEAFTDPVSALERFTRGPEDFDAVITDMTMPGMCGDEFAKALRKVRPNVPIVLCTGYSDKLSGKDAAAIGVDVLQLKPLSTAQLIEAIHSAIKLRNLS